MVTPCGKRSYGPAGLRIGYGDDRRTHRLSAINQLPKVLVRAGWYPHPLFSARLPVAAAVPVVSGAVSAVRGARHQVPGPAWVP